MKPRQGKEIKQVCSIRIEPSSKELVKQEFGSVQTFFDFYLELTKKLLQKKLK